jgi:hypothetical protein
MLSHPLGSNIQHILEDLDMGSEDFVGMADDNLGPSTVAAAQTPQKPLSTILEMGVSSRAPTLKRPQSSALDGADRASGSKKPRVSKAPEASDSKSTVEIQPEGANWTFEGRLAKLEGDLKGNPFKAVVDLVDHDKLHLKKHDISARGMAEEMLIMHFLVRIPTLCCHTYSTYDYLILYFLLVGLPQVCHPLLLLQKGLDPRRQSRGSEEEAGRGRRRKCQAQGGGHQTRRRPPSSWRALGGDGVRGF